MKTRFYYGWVIVAASFLISMYVGGSIFYGFTALFLPIADDFGWSYAQISLAISLRGLESSLLAPLIGNLTDRFGPRKLVFGGALVTALGMFLLGRAESLATFYLSFLFVTVGMSTSGMTIMMTVIANWFHRRVGMASGIVVSGFACGGLLIPWITVLIESHGWRGAVNWLAIGMVVITVPLSLLLRKTPEQYGQLPDGAVPEVIAVGSEETPYFAKSPSFNVRQALGNRTFWMLTLTFTGFSTVVSSAITHIMPYLDSIGIDRITASLFAMALPLLSIVGRLGLGWSGDKTDRRKITTAAFALMAAGMLCFALAAAVDSRFIWPSLGLFSIGYGGATVMRPALTREFFGRDNFGSVFGTLIAINMIGAIIGPTLVGWVFDMQSSYALIWLVFAVICILAIAAVMTCPASPKVNFRRAQPLD